MLKVTITTESSNFSPEQGDLDQESTMQVNATEEFLFQNRGDYTGMREIKLAAKIRKFLQEQKL